MNCNKYWNTRKLFGHLGSLLREQAMNPSDGSIELELDDCKTILKMRGVLV